MGKLNSKALKEKLSELKYNSRYKFIDFEGETDHREGYKMALDDVRRYLNRQK